MNNLICRWLEKYIAIVSRHIVIALLTIAVTTAGALWLSSKLSIKGGLKELLPENYPSVVELDRALLRIGGVGSLIVTVESPDANANKRFMDALARQLNTLPEGTVRYLDYKSGDVRRFYEKYALYYMDPADLDELYDAARHRIDTEKLTRANLFVNLEDGDPLENKIDDIKHRNESNNASPIKTTDDYYGEGDGKFLIMLIRPYENSLSTDAARYLIATVENQVSLVNPAQFDPAMKIGFCGNVKSTVEEYDTLKKDIVSTAILCIGLVGLVIALFFMRLRVVFLLGATLIIALAWTFAITYLAIGYLNSQTAFLGSIILGTGINYGIIVMARYVEERRRGHPHTMAMRDALIHTLKATFLAAATTAVAFLVLLLAKIRGLNQFGLIGAYGVMLCWVATFTVLPVIALATERVWSMVTPKAAHSHGMIFYKRFGHCISTASAKIVSATIALTIVSVVLVAFFAHDAIEYDFTKLRNKTSVATGTEALEHRVSKLFNDSMTPSVVLVNKMEDAALVCDAITAKNRLIPETERRVGSCRSIYSLVPKDLPEKLPRVQKFAALLNENDKYIKRLSPKERERIDSLRDGIGRPPGLKDIPKDITKHFEDLEHQPGAVVFISPRTGMLLSDGRNLVRFADTIRDVTLPDGRVLHAAGSSLIFADLVDAIRREAPVVTLASFLCVLLFVALLVRTRHASGVIILCVVIGVVTMLGLTALFRIKLNFFNFIALPLTFGIGVDYAVNMVLRLHKDNLTHLEHAFRHTGVAVVLCSLTTTIGYAVLIVANNQALASFGVLAIMGEVTCLLAAILLAPALLIYAKTKSRILSEKVKQPLLSLLVMGVVALPAAAFADTDVNVYDDVVYLYLDKLAASNLIKSYSPNQRPLSRFAVAKWVEEAESRCQDDCASGDKTIIFDLNQKFPKRGTIDFVPIKEVNLSWTATNQPESAVPNDGLGNTGGTVQPLLSYKYGQHYLKYANFYLDTAHYVSATPYFSAYIQPQAYGVSGSNPHAWLWFWRAYVKAGVGDFEVQIGRDELKWGPGEQSLVFSDNFKGFDMIKLTTPSTFRLPWVFKHLGQWRFTTFFALLGKGFSNPNAILSAYRVDYQPIHWFDFGFDHAVIMGGRGAMSPSPLVAIDEYVGFTSSSGNFRASSNHIMGADFSVRVPPLLGVEFYGKLLLEDTQKETAYMLINNAGWLAGLNFPKLDAAQKFSLRTEFVYTGQFSYRHSFYASGWSLDGKFLGYDAGDDTYSVTSSLRHQFNFDEFVMGSFRYLYRLNNTYMTSLDASGDPNGLITVTTGPKEQHYIFKASGTKKITKWLNVYADMGLDGVVNRGFVQNNNGVDFSTQIKFSFHDLVKQ